MNNRTQEVIKRALLSLIIVVLPALVLLVIFITNNENISESVIGHRFVFIILCLALPLFLLQVFIPWFSKKLILGVLLSFILFFILSILNVSYAQNICNQVNGDWRIEYTKLSSGAINRFTRNPTCYITNDIYQKVLVDHPFLTSNFTYFKVK